MRSWWRWKRKLQVYFSQIFFRNNLCQVELVEALCGTLRQAQSDNFTSSERQFHKLRASISQAQSDNFTSSERQFHKLRVTISQAQSDNFDKLRVTISQAQSDNFDKLRVTINQCLYLNQKNNKSYCPMSFRCLYCKAPITSFRCCPSLIFLKSWT